MLTSNSETYLPLPLSAGIKGVYSHAPPELVLSMSYRSLVTLVLTVLDLLLNV